MAERTDAVVVGGGVGGLAAAIRLRLAGHRVVVLERNAEPGGKLAVRSLDGYHFDIGPSLVTLPQVFDELFRLAGTTLVDEVDLVRLDPQFHYHWSDGSRLVMGDDGCDAPGYADWIEHGGRIWDVSERTFFAGPMTNPLALARRVRRPRDLTDIDALRTLHRSASACFDDPRMVQWAGRYATYSGSSPFAAPATLGCIAAVEHRYGCWYPRGGLGAMRDAIVRVAERVGVEIRCASEVVTITADARIGGSVDGVVVADGSHIDAGVVVANVDAEHLYRDLVPDTGAARKVRRAAPSTSAFVLLAGVRGITPGLAHHNVWFSSDDAAEFGQLADGRCADEPTVYACVSSVTDPTQAPAGCENWFLMVNVPAGADVDRAAHSTLVLDRLAAHGIDLRPRLVVTDTITPADIAERYRSPGGAIYGTSSNGARAAFARPANRGARRGLYLVGGSSHPGGGLPLVTLSARIVADMIAADRR